MSLNVPAEACRHEDISAVDLRDLDSFAKRREGTVTELENGESNALEAPRVGRLIEREVIAAVGNEEIGSLHPRRSFEESGETPFGFRAQGDGHGASGIEIQFLCKGPSRFR